MLTSNYKRLGQIQGFDQIADFISGMYGLPNGDGKVNVIRTLRYILKTIQSTNNLYKKYIKNFGIQRELDDFRQDEQT